MSFPAETSIMGSQCVITALLLSFVGTQSQNVPMLSFDPAGGNFFKFENEPVGSTLFKLIAYDPDQGDTVAFSSVNDETRALVSIGPATNPSSGRWEAPVYLNKSLDRDRNARQRDLVFQAKDSQGYMQERPAKLIIQDVNDNPPYFINLPYRLTIKEGSTSVNLTVFNVEATDPDNGPGGAVRYSMAADAQGADAEYNNTFVILNENYGNITLNRPLDYERRNYYQYKIFAQDKGTPACPGVGCLCNSVSEPSVNCNGDPAIFIVVVEDVQDTPPFFERLPYFTSVLENATTGKSVFQVSAQDGDRGVSNAIQYSMVTTTNTTAVAPGGGNEIRHDVTCGETEMSFSIPIPTNVTIPQIVTLSDPRCHLDTGGHRLQGRTPLNDCGTKVAFINDKVVFTNDIYLTYDKGSGSDLVIPIHCSYNRSDDLRLSYLPIVRQVLFTEEGVGHFGFAIQQFQDASYSAPVNEASYPLRVRPQQEVFVQLKLDEADLPVAASHPQAYGIEVEMCIASPSASMTEARQGQHQEFIVNGCPANNGVRLLNNDNHGTSSNLTTATPAHPHDNIFRFCFEGVTFSSLPSGSPSGLVYIHCHVALCPRDKCRPSNASCPATPAAADPAEAVPESDGHHVARRSVGAWRSQAAGHSLSTGPLWIIAVSEESNASSSPAVIALSVVAAVACLVAIAVIVAWRRGPRRGGGHYERVKVTEE